MVYKSVCFGEVEVRTYPMILGDHPGSRRKTEIPVTIDWKYMEEERSEIEMYEFYREQTRKNRKKLRMSNDKRREYLLSVGYQPHEFVPILMENAQIHESRRENAGKENWDKFDNLLNTSGKVLSSPGQAVKDATTLAVSIVGNSGRAAVGYAVNAGTQATTFAVDGTKRAIGEINSFGQAAGTRMIDAGKMTTNAVKDAGKLTTNAVLDAGKKTTSAVTAAGRNMSMLMRLRRRMSGPGRPESSNQQTEVQ